MKRTPFWLIASIVLGLTSCDGLVEDMAERGSPFQNNTEMITYMDMPIDSGSVKACFLPLDNDFSSMCAIHTYSNSKPLDA